MRRLALTSLAGLLFLSSLFAEETPVGFIDEDDLYTVSGRQIFRVVIPGNKRELMGEIPLHPGEVVIGLEARKLQEDLYRDVVFFVIDSEFHLFTLQAKLLHAFEGSQTGDILADMRAVIPKNFQFVGRNHIGPFDPKIFENKYILGVQHHNTLVLAEFERFSKEYIRAKIYHEFFDQERWEVESEGKSNYRVGEGSEGLEFQGELFFGLDEIPIAVGSEWSDHDIFFWNSRTGIIRVRSVKHVYNSSLTIPELSSACSQELRKIRALD